MPSLNPLLPMLSLSAAMLVGAAGCSVAPRQTAELEIRHVAPVEPDRFAAGRELLTGEMAPQTGEQWLPGDSVLLGVALDAGNIQAEWYIRATAVQKVTMSLDGHSFNLRDSVRVRRSGSEDEWVRVEYDVVVVEIELFDSRAQLLSMTSAMMPEVCLQHGLYEYIEQTLAGVNPFETGAVLLDHSGELLAGEDLRRAVAGWIAIMKLPEFLQRDRGMEQLIWRIIDRPGLLSILANRGIQMEVGLNGADARPEYFGIGKQTAYRVPVALSLNGRQAVRCEIVVTRGDPPFGPCNGLVALDAMHPNDPSQRLAVRLLAAQRGQATPIAMGE